MTQDGRVRLSAKEAADHIGISRSTLSKWRMRGEGPRWHRVGPRLVRYFKDEVDEWLEECDRKDGRRPKAAA